MERITKRTFYLVAVTAVAAVPFVVVGLASLLRSEPVLAAAILVGIAVLALRPVRVSLASEISLAELPILAGILLLPPIAIVPLAAVARAASDVVLHRTPVQVARNDGGDEFAIVMPETARDEAEKVVGRLMELLDSSRIDLGDERSIAMPARSWGVSSYPTDGTTARELVENADTRAYARKRAKA